MKTKSMDVFSKEMLHCVGWALVMLAAMTVLAPLFAYIKTGLGIFTGVVVAVATLKLLWSAL